MRNRLLPKVLALGVAFAASPLQAAMVSYHLDQSNELQDGIAYLRVDIEDIGTDIRFTVSLLEPLLSIAPDGGAAGRFGIQVFGFNVAGTGALNPVANIAGLPSGWTVQSNPNGSLDGFGKFEVVADTTGRFRQSPTLQFFVVGVDGDTPATYVARSRGGNSQYFAAHVAGFLDQNPGPGTLTSAFFAGSAAASVVPLPAAGWLLLSGLVGVVGMRRYGGARLGVSR